jgi:trehalose/maltose hydrolase-like predicted phosphorylase
MKQNASPFLPNWKAATGLSSSITKPGMSLWKSDIQIEGDDQSQQDVHSMLYHLYSFSRAGTAYSPSPMGLSGLGYNGHVFWDWDVWMYPAMLVLHPEIARSMVEYRFERLGMLHVKMLFRTVIKGRCFRGKVPIAG